MKRTYSFEHSNDVFGVIKRTNLVITSAIDDGHSLQANTLHRYLRRQQEAMIEVVEELISTAN